MYYTYLISECVESNLKIKSQELNEDTDVKGWVVKEQVNIKFLRGEDAGQRNRNVEKYLTDDITNFLLMWSTSSQMLGSLTFDNFTSSD